MERIKKAIKDQEFHNVYLLYGEEGYLRKYYKKALVQAILPEQDEMNYSCLKGDKIDVKKLIEEADTMPFFAERRVIVVEQSRFFKSSNEELANYIKAVPSTTTIIFEEEEVDKRGKLFKAVKNKGIEVECKQQKEQDLLRWIAVKIKKEGKKITEQDARHFLAKIGNDMSELEVELEKLFSYTYGEPVITAKQIDEICMNHCEDQVFQMIDALVAKDVEKTMRFYGELLGIRKEPLAILPLLTRQFRILLHTKELVKKGYGPAQIASALKLSPYFVKNYIRQASGFSVPALRNLLEELADMEERIKTGLIKDRTSIELFIIKHSRKEL